MSTNENANFTEFALCDCDWDELVQAADGAGRHAAREFAERCSPWELGRTGQARVRIEPVESPVASWLRQRGHARLTADASAVVVTTRVRPEDLGNTDNAIAKATSVLTRRAYASAYCTVLAEEAGVTATPEIEPDPVPRPRAALGSPETPHAPAAPPTTAVVESADATDEPGAADMTPTG